MQRHGSISIFRRLSLFLRARWRSVGHAFKRNTIAIAVALAHLYLFSSPMGQRVELQLTNLWFELRGALNPPPSIVIVSTDDISYEQLHVSKGALWPRRFHTQLIERLSKAGASTVFFDMVFREKGQNPEEDQKFAEALSKIPSIIGKYTTFSNSVSASGVVERKVEEIVPNPIFTKNAFKVVSLQLSSDSSGVIRFLNPIEQNQLQIPAMMEALSKVLPSDSVIPSTRSLINYYGPPETIPTISYFNALDERTPADEFFRNKVVFVGRKVATDRSNAEKDSALTPISSIPMYGVEIHANIAGNLIDRSWIERGGYDNEVLVITLTTFLLALAVLSVRPTVGFVILICVVLCWTVASYQTFIRGYFIPGLLLTTVVMPISFLCSTLFYYLELRRVQQSLEFALKTDR